MAWLVRSAREDILTSSITPPELGPGAYETAVPSITRRGPSYAPFASTSERGVSRPPDSVTPGPGNYFHMNNPSQGVAPASSSTFVSRVERFDKRNVSSAPGPGAYFEPAQWGTPRPGFTSRKVARGRDVHPRSGLEWVRTASAPSIPAIEQSYGYIETTTGELIPQQRSLPNPSHSSAPVIGAFDRPKLSHHRTGTAVDFSKGSRRLVSWSQPGTIDNASMAASVSSTGGGNGGAGVPGPGHYDIDLPERAERERKEQRQRHVMVMMKERLTGKINENKNRNNQGPEGPGYYLPPSSFDKAPTDPITQCFGSRSTRSFLPAQTSNYTPGPGAYESASVKAAFKGGVETGLTGILPSAILTDGSQPTSSFSSKVSRFTKPTGQSTITPGPGTYVAPGNIVDELAKKRKGINKSFGQTATRFKKEDKDKTPSPGSYNIEGASGNSAGAASALSHLHNPNSVAAVSFKSKTARLIPGGLGRGRVPVGVAAVLKMRKEMGEGPPVGAYDLDFDSKERQRRVMEAQQKGPQHFLSTEARFESPGTIRNLVQTSHLGPGRYRAEAVRVAIDTSDKTGITSVFKSIQRRFTPPSSPRRLPHRSEGEPPKTEAEALNAALEVFATARATPGPGAYEIGGSSLVKRSYNVTIDPGSARKAG